MEPRLATSVLVTALMRRAESEGGFATVLTKGDPTAGSVLVIVNERGGNQRVLERILQAEGRYSWHQITEEKEKIQALLERRRRFDPDLWLIELNVASGERFAAEMKLID